MCLHTGIELIEITRKGPTNRQKELHAILAHSPASDSSSLGETCLGVTAVCQLSLSAHL